jgi:hypothetical protein
VSVIDLSGVVESLASHETLAVKRPPSGVYVDGRYSAGATTNFTVLASVQPLTGEDLLVLPEGERTDDAIEIFTLEKLQPSQQGAAELGDLVTYLGRDYRIRLAEDWGANGNYYRSVATRVGQ